MPKRLILIYYEARKWAFIILTYVLAPLIYFLIWRRKKDFAEKSQLRILIIPHLTRVGDLVCATPVFRAVKKQYPDCYLAVLVQKFMSGIIKNNPYIDEVIFYRSVNFSGVLQDVRKRSFDWGFCLSGTAIGTIIMFLGLIPNRVKLTRDGRPLTEILTDWMATNKLFYKHHTYLPRFNLKLLELIGIYGPEEVKEVFISSENNFKVKDFLKKNNISENDSLIGISITTGNKVKEWGDEKFKEVARRVVEKYNVKIIFIGAKSDEPRIDAVLSTLDNGRFFKAIDFSLEELPSLIKILRLFISGDTGPMHIAHALRVPLIDIIGPVDLEELTPKSGKNIILKPPAYITPSVFAFKKSGRPEEYKKALEAIGVADVLRAVDTLMR